MEALADNPLFMDLVTASIFLAFACQGLVRGLYKQIMPFLVVVLAGIGAAALSASLTGPVTELVYPKVVDALLGAYKDSGVDFTRVSLNAVERLPDYVRLILLSLLWTGLMAALTVIKNTFQLAAKLPVVKQVDRLGGAALGLVECALIFWAAAWLAKHAGFTWLAERAEGTRFLSLFV